MKIQCVVGSKSLDPWGKAWLQIQLPPKPPENLPSNAVGQPTEPSAYIQVPADEFPGLDVGATVQVEVTLA